MVCRIWPGVGRSENLILLTPPRRLCFSLYVLSFCLSVSRITQKSCRQIFDNFWMGGISDYQYLTRFLGSHGARCGAGILTGIFTVTWWGNRTKFADNSRSCRRILTILLRVGISHILLTKNIRLLVLECLPLRDKAYRENFAGSVLHWWRFVSPSGTSYCAPSASSSTIFITTTKITTNDLAWKHYCPDHLALGRLYIIIIFIHQIHGRQ